MSHSPSGLVAKYTSTSEVERAVKLRQALKDKHLPATIYNKPLVLLHYLALRRMNRSTQ